MDSISAAEGLEERGCVHIHLSAARASGKLRHGSEHLLVRALQATVARQGGNAARRAQRARRHERRHNGGDTQTGSECGVAAEPRPSRNPRPLRFLWIDPVFGMSGIDEHEAGNQGRMARREQASRQRAE